MSPLFSDIGLYIYRLIRAHDIIRLINRRSRPDWWGQRFQLASVTKAGPLRPTWGLETRETAIRLFDRDRASSRSKLNKLRSWIRPWFACTLCDNELESQCGALGFVHITRSTFVFNYPLSATVIGIDDSGSLALNFSTMASLHDDCLYPSSFTDLFATEWRSPQIHFDRAECECAVKIKHISTRCFRLSSRFTPFNAKRIPLNQSWSWLCTVARDRKGMDLIVAEML